MKLKNYKILAFAALFAFAACTDQNPVEKAKEELIKLKANYSDLSIQIDSLEKIIENDTSSATEKYKVPVRLKAMKPEVFKHYFEASGIVEAINSAFVSPEMNGQIKEILVEEGQRVVKGQLLVKLNTAVTEKTIEELKTGLELSAKIYEKQKELWDQNIGSEIEFLQAKNAKVSLEKKIETLTAQLQMAQIRAPFSGIVDRVFQKVGEMASPGRQVLLLVDLTKVKLRADISEDYLPVIKAGETVDVSFPSYPDYKIKSKISRTGNVINPSNRNFEIQLLLDNKEEMLKPNMLAIIKINDFINDSAMVVPSIIVKNDIEGEFVFIANKTDNNFVAEKTRVKSGASYGDKTTIVSGLKFNDKVIVEGYNMVTTGINVIVKK